MRGLLCGRVAALCDNLLARDDLGEATEVVEELRRSLDEPLRVAVAGRVNAGKSTLVNALLRQPVAPTDVSECTKVVTWYRYGVPERVEVHTRDGAIDKMPLCADGTLPSTLGTLVEDISQLVVFLSSDALQKLTLIDTPGLSSLHEDRSRATRELLAIDQASRVAAAKADALVLVVNHALHADERDAVAAFRAQFGGLAPSALNAVGVLNKVDQITGSGDPRLVAATLAREYGEALRSTVAAVVPLIGLHGETADCGLLTERDAAAMRELAALPAPVRSSLTVSVDRFVAAAAPVPSEERLRILERLDIYGIERCLALIDEGNGSAAQLTKALRQGSGIEQLRKELDETFSRNADSLKSAAALTTLDQLSYVSSSRTWGASLRAQIEDLRLEPGMHRLSEIRAMQEWAAGTVPLDADLARSLHHLCTGVTDTARLGLQDDAPPAAVAAAAANTARVWRAFGNDPRATPTQRWLADVACRSSELLWTRVASDLPGATRG